MPYLNNFVTNANNVIVSGGRIVEPEPVTCLGFMYHSE